MQITVYQKQPVVFTDFADYYLTTRGLENSLEDKAETYKELDAADIPYQDEKDVIKAEKYLDKIWEMSHWISSEFSSDDPKSSLFQTLME